ncbi:ribosomal protein L28 [Thermoclostridium stercorarium subsp. stercorarium DSM 8532]|jgi:large subunit ribosomal protein L28|uniref:Large ribosomal subunit protein bL28 n=3 Tax=Thermoclostridium stercorarium TaxID=1510 RepID=L7VMU5_THES1|nr:50S ribosomal protein L28 [Thermoclostridium stercorarium]AGC67786.1 ribosomal protein L28 [Thermoclostridium stercorarium subsp. stercorarium DSM 8532]AGI38829.1 ribosomal protein L28P [Thermoclostridium stercorarium subsp. stercorarium DSM 8532]ANW98191.1 50S ribosomal protein L28 [Thermoclostridium stercorarium subsp. thermolacticum DSM 2910]ANX00732.1 50S ribosomal protein L28 [Thermoclostridium stercorarium subsp. leptospartum DSM 9219]UZQ86349.1 50S ribosomal protein L28 [Thermoclostr
MAKCEICGKGQLFGNQISHSHRRTNRAWKPNIKRVRLTINGVTKRMAVCTSCIRSHKNTV